MIYCIDLLNSLAILIHARAGGGPPGFTTFNMILADFICIFTLAYVSFIIFKVQNGKKISKGIMFRLAINIGYMILDIRF